MPADPGVEVRLVVRLSFLASVTRLTINRVLNFDL
jgi:hypothetical protein